MQQFKPLTFVEAEGSVDLAAVRVVFHGAQPYAVVATRTQSFRAEPSRVKVSLVPFEVAPVEQGAGGKK